MPNPLYLSRTSANALMVMLDTEIDSSEEVLSSKHEPEDYINLGYKLIAYGEYREWYEAQDCFDPLGGDNE